MQKIKKSIGRKSTFFIGIDVSKHKFDYAVLTNKEFLFHRIGNNTNDSIIMVLAQLKNIPGFSISKAVFCMEQSGFYCNHLISALLKVKAKIALENPVHIKRSLGIIRGKSDKIDAIRIAEFARKNIETLSIWVPKRTVLLKLANYFTLRNRLLGLRLALEVPLKEHTSFVDKGVASQHTLACKKSLNGIKTDITDLEASIGLLISSDDHLSRLLEIITSVPGVGRITAIQMIICTNEFKDITTPKKFACYSGVAPFKRESGLMFRKARISPFANKKMKSLLHCCALTSLRCNEEIKRYYDRKVTEGKPKMAVINAIRNKIILRIFASLKQNRLHIENISASELTRS